MEWKQTYFQVIETMYNRNQRIDQIVVESSQRIIILIDKKTPDQNTILHIYNYNWYANGTDKDFEFKRIQIISTSLDLSKSNVFLFNEYNNRHLQMFFCDKDLLDALKRNRCEYFLWRNEGIENIPSFKRLDRRPELFDSLSFEIFEARDEQIPTNQLITSNEILVFLSKVILNYFSN